MPAPSFVHLRLHSEYSIVDGTVRIDEAVDAAAADGMPALALTDLSNAFGLIKFYQRGARAPASSPSPAATCGSRTTASATRRFAPSCSRPIARVICACATGCTRAYRTNQHRGRAELRREWFAEGTDGLIALSGAPPRRRRRRAGCRATPQAAHRAACDWAAWFPQRYYLEVQRAGRPDDDALVGGHRRARGGARVARGRDPSGAVPDARGFPAARSARVHRGRATSSPTRAGRGASRPSSTSRRRPRWPRASPTCPRRSPTAWRSRSAAT